MADPFLGQIIPWPLDWAPRLWHICDGSLINISDNSALYSLLGTKYGGDGRTNFKLPDLRGRVALGYGHGPGLTAYPLGLRGGAEHMGLSKDQMPMHDHTSAGIPANSGDAEAGVVPGPTAVPARVAGGGRGKYVDSYSTTEDTTLMPGANTGDAGGGQAHENRQPYLVMNYIICLNGIYPSRN